MSRTGYVYDNSVMESFFATLKTELVHRRRYQTRAEAITDLFAYIEGFYNRRRRHSSLGYLSPEQFESVQQQQQPCLICLSTLLGEDQMCCGEGRRKALSTHCCITVCQHCLSSRQHKLEPSLKLGLRQALRYPRMRAGWSFKKPLSEWTGIDP
jgi:hypothetical protein